MKCCQQISWSYSTCWARSKNGSNTPVTDQSPSIARGYFHYVTVYATSHILFQTFQITYSSVAVSDVSAGTHDLPTALDRPYTMSTIISQCALTTRMLSCSLCLLYIAHCLLLVCKRCDGIGIYGNIMLVFLYPKKQILNLRSVWLNKIN